MTVWIKQELKYENNPIKALGEICRTAPENMVDFLFDSVLRLFFVCFWILRDPNKCHKNTQPTKTISTPWGGIN